MSIFEKIQSWLAPLRPEPDAVPAEAPAPAPQSHASYIAGIIAEVRQQNDPNALATDMSYYDGHVREAALKRANALRAPALLPAVVARLNDWVPQVRARAQALVLDWLPSLDADAALRLLGAVQHLRDARRSDHASWLGKVERIVVAQVGAGTIVDGVANPDIAIARTCFRLLEEHGLAGPATRVRVGLADGTDIVLVRKAAEALVLLDGQERAAMGRLALQSHFGIVRAIALRRLLADEVNGAEALATDMLADPHGWVRLVASTFLERRGIDSASLYAARLTAPGSSNTVLRGCLMGLAETGKRTHLDLVRRMTSHASARVRVNAFAAWLHLAPEEKDDIARHVLADGAHRVRTLVMSMHRKHGAFVPVDDALALLREHGDVELMLRYTEHEPWRWLQLILELEPASHADAGMRAHLREQLIGWIDAARRSCGRPTPAQRALFAEPTTQAILRELLGHDPMRAAALAFEFRAM
jgi:hypothetical protein